MNARLILVTLMSALLPASSILAAQPQNQPQPEHDANLPRRTLSAIQLDVRAALRAEASTRRQGQNTQEVLRLIELYREMAAHPKRDQSPFLARLGVQVRSRLRKVRDHIERQNARAQRDADKNEAQHELAAPKTHVLAQQVAPPGGAAPGAQPAGPLAGAGPTFDYGPDLVDLIQRTISPATWDINGGNSSIVYFSPLRVIVVTAPGTVHGQVGDVLGQLRAAP